MNTREKYQIQPLAYSIKEAVLVSSLGRTVIFNLIKDGKLKAIKIGNRTLIPASELRKLLSIDDV